jgi:hypothetical protein
MVITVAFGVEFKSYERAFKWVIMRNHRNQSEKWSLFATVLK